MFDLSLRFSLKFLLTLTILSAVLKNNVDGAIKCPVPPPPPPPPGQPPTNTKPIFFEFGDPVIFVTTKSQKYAPYSLADVHRRTSILEEYLMVGYHKNVNFTGALVEEIQMVFYDGTKRLTAEATESPDLVHQNLEKELYWRYFNSTGIYPSMTIVNTTKRTSLQFHYHRHNGNESTTEIAFDTTLSAKTYFQEPQVPYNVIFEIPANSRVLRKEKTLIQYQSFSLWRWKLSETVKTWSEITGISDPYKDNPLISNFHKIENPCIKDMFLLYMPRTSKASVDDKLVYLASPLIQTHLGENWFYDMKTDEHPWWPEAPNTVVLTNDHFIILTNTLMWVSQSLNDSSISEIDLQMAGDYKSRPTLNYERTNPCGKHEDTIDCFLAEKDMVKNGNKFTKERLFYTPVCYLYQFPNYQDYLIFTVERTTSYAGVPVTDFSVLYAQRPYSEWKVLFSNVAIYKTFVKSDVASDVDHTRHIPIETIVGIFFNHHLRHFDITVRLQGSSPKYIRFVLPEPTTAFDGYGEHLTEKQLIKAGATHNKKLLQLNGTLGKGFSENEFPANFLMDSVVVNGDTLDVYFIGNQFWIAEAGGHFVYTPLTGISNIHDSVCNRVSTPDPKFKFNAITECSFNHPDKTYLCMTQDRSLLLAGKIGSRYTPSIVQLDSIQELIKAQEVNPWVIKYHCQLVQERSVFVTAFSGRVLMWYMHEPDDEVNSAKAGISTGCSNPDDEPVLCDDLAKWQACTVEPNGVSGFRLLVIDPTKFNARKQNTDGPLTPFLMDSNTAVLYEGVVPQYATGPPAYDYFNEVFVASKIFCTNYELLKIDTNDEYKHHNCELFVRHIKPVNKFLDGFRRVIYVTVLKSLPMIPVPVDIVVLVQPNSNTALIKLNDYFHSPTWDFKPEHIGQTLYAPGNFSILLYGFPFANDLTVMEGYTTMHFQHQRRFFFRAFYTFLMDLSTKQFRMAQVNRAAQVIQNTDSRWNAIDNERMNNKKKEDDIRANMEKRWKDGEFAPLDPVTQTPVSLFKGTNPLPAPIARETEEKDLLQIRANEEKNKPNPPESIDPVPSPPAADLVHGLVPYDKRLIWYVIEDKCHYILSLVNNPVLKTSGGRISLDLYDRISFEVLLRPLTPLGKILMYRPLLVVTNSNPNILRLEVLEKLKGDPQYFQFLLAPTGFDQGVAVITVRTRASSLHCPQSSSLTLIVLCHRDVGRRLHVNYPIPSCKPEEELGMYPRPWYNEMEACITSEELLDPGKTEIVRYQRDRRVVVYVPLPPNYRPPSYDGTDIPQTRNVYNADPSQKAYKAWYQVSRETIELDRCAGKSARKQCACTEVDRLLDDEELTECKEKVFATERTGTNANKAVTISVTYDRIMQDKDQNPELFSPKRNWSVSIEEINGRGEWYITSEHTPYLKMINEDGELHRGRRYYDMNKFKVTLLGTGLFHFKVKLGNWESFGPVTGYFILYARTDDINHVHLFMILLGTIIFCMTMVLVGFLVNRKRLSSMLPIQPMSHKRKLKLL